MVRITIIFLVLVFGANPAFGATYTVTNCTYANVQAAVNSASDGDEVYLNCASGTWSSNVIIAGKGITLRGNGMNNTTIDGALRINLDCANNSLMTVTGINWLTSSGAPGFYNGIISFPPCNSAACSPMKGKCETQNKLRIDNNRFTVGGSATKAILSLDDPINNFPMGGHLFGLVDNNIFIANVDYAALRMEANHNWYGESNLGTWKMLFFENNTFDYSSVRGGNQCATDFMTGMNVVVRYNTFINSAFCTHGADTVYGSIQEFEVYNNTFTATNGNVHDGTRFRGGTGLIYDNTFTTNGGTYSGSRVNLQYYRSDKDASPCGGHTCIWGLCDGTHPPNGTILRDNNDEAHGWRCLQQPGVNWNTTTQRWVTQPIYHWNNLFNGSPVTTTGVLWGAGESIVADREYYTYTTSFNGTSGTGRGTLASRPATCTTGVGYWGTDTNILYKCTATNTWSSYYTPYTYPHPLRSGAPPAPPTGLSII